MIKPLGSGKDRLLTIKILIAILLGAALFFMFQTNREQITKNHKMIKHIRNETRFKQNLAHLAINKTTLAKYVADISKKNKNDTDLEKLKSDYMNDLLQLVKSSDLKVDSYNSMILKSGEADNETHLDIPQGCVLFRYDISVVGDFIQVLRFFSLLHENTRVFRVRGYDIRQHMGKFVRLILNAEIIGVELDF